MRFVVPMICLAMLACSNTPASQTPASSAAIASARPDVGKAVKHFKEHVTYPASRAAVLAACANTPEFSMGEKKWISDNLPDKSFASAEEIATALRL